MDREYVSIENEQGTTGKKEERTDGFWLRLSLGHSTLGIVFA